MIAPSLPPTKAGPDFTTERQRHVGFGRGGAPGQPAGWLVGREDVLAQLDAWLYGPGQAGWVVVTGSPGMGKSAILAAWLERREAAGERIAYHLIRSQVADWDQPGAIAESLAAQIEALFPDCVDPEAKPERRWIELLGRVSSRLASDGRLVIVIDGLDETRAEPGANPLPRFLPHVVLSGIRVLGATRPTDPHLGWVLARSPLRLDLDDPRWAGSNQAVVRGFWQRAASEYQPPLSAEMLGAAIERADGNVLHAVMLHDHLRRLEARERRAEQIPDSLAALIGEIWRRAAVHEAVRTGLGLLCAAREALPLDVLAAVAGLRYEDRQQFLRDARPLLYEERGAWDGADAYRPRHDWVRELIQAWLGNAALKAHHASLAQRLATWPTLGEPAARRYALRHALLHRCASGDYSAAWQVAADMAFIEQKCRELGSHEVEADIVRIAEHSRACGDAVIERRFRDLGLAVSRESHWLRTAPQAAAAVLWNRLRRAGWSAAELDQQLRLGPETRFLRVRSVATRESSALQRDLVGHLDWVRACAATPDGRQVVSGADDGVLKVWDLATGQAVITLQGHAGRVNACAVTPDGRWVVSASDDKLLKVWDLATGQAVIALEGHTGKVNACAVTPDGRQVVSGSSDKSIKLWDIVTGRQIATLAGHVGPVNACAVTPDGRYVVSGSDDRRLEVWDLATRQAVVSLHGHGSAVSACLVTPDGRFIVSASLDGTLKIWDRAPRSEPTTLRGHALAVNACTVTSDGRTMVSASHDKTLKVWDLATRREIATLAGHSLRVNACAITPDGRQVVSTSDDQTVKVWDLAAGGAATTLEGHAGHVRACAVTPDQQRVVTASYDGTLKVWGLATGREIAVLRGHAGWVNACAATADGRVVSASADETLKVWDLATQREIGTLQGHSGMVNACTVTSNGRWAISASADETLRVWDLATLHEVGALHGHRGSVLACAATPDGRVVSGADDRTLKVWDLETGREVVTLQGHAGWIHACAVTPDGRHAVSSSSDRTLKVWDLATGQDVATLQGHSAWVHACAVTPDGRHVVSAAADKKLRLWDLETGACLFTHRGSSPYLAVAVSATMVVAGDATGSVWFLDLPERDASRVSPSQSDRWITDRRR